MIAKLTAIAATALLATGLAAAPCKDAKGKFVKCPTSAAMMPAKPGVNKDAKGRCHVASGPKKGQLTKC